MTRFALVLVALTAGCGDEPRTCKLQPGDTAVACSDAVILTLRETTSFFPPDDEIVAMYDFLARVRPLLCYFRHTFAVYEYGDIDMPVIRTTNPALVEAWSALQVETGVPEADALFADRGAYRVFARNNGYEFVVYFPSAVSWDVLAGEVEVLADTTVVREPVNVGLGYDIRRERSPTDDAWIVTFDVGWGDCFSICTYSHRWEVLAPDDGTSPSIIADSGDEIPAELQCTQ